MWDSNVSQPETNCDTLMCHPPICYKIICLSKLSRDYFAFFQEWFTNFHNPITVVCFEEIVQDPVNEVRRMLNFLEFPDYRKRQNPDQKRLTKDKRTVMIVRWTLGELFDAGVFLTLKRLECVNEDLEGQFHREHHAPSNHVKLYSSDQIQRIKNIIDSLSLMLKRNEF